MSPARAVPAARATRGALARPAQSLAPRLLGWRLVRCLPDGTRLSGRIVEVEAYVGVRDRACHSFNGRRTPRVEPMYARAGTAYVYFTYGMHFCMNVVCGGVGEPVAVLLRALEPVEGVEAMRRLRGPAPARPDHDLARGPANLCRALAIDGTLNQHDLVEGDALWLEPGALRRGERAAVVRTPRVGIDRAGDWTLAPLRWLVNTPPARRCVSGPRPPAPVRPPGKPARRASAGAGACIPPARGTKRSVSRG